MLCVNNNFTQYLLKQPLAGVILHPAGGSDSVAPNSRHSSAIDL
jgi:hypothetical protein